MQEYIVIEIQINTEGAVSTLATAYSDYRQAQHQYHTILAAAAVSALPMHSAMIVSPIGNVIERQGYNRIAREEMDL